MDGKNPSPQPDHFCNSVEQENVRQTLETLANAGIKVWMLTGDKVETAKCIAISAKLVQRNQNIFQFLVTNETEAAQQLQAFSFLR